MRRGFTVTEFAAATLIGLPLLIIGIQIMPGLMKSSAMGTEACTVTMLLRSSWEDLRSDARSTSGFDIDYTLSSVAFDAPYERYKRSVIDSTTSDFKQVGITVWHDDDNDGSQDAKEIGYSITGFLTRNVW